MRPHPLGVLPEGNRYLVSPEAAAASARARLEGLGAFAALPDATLMRLLSGGDEDDGVGAEALASLSLVSRVFRAFACHEDLWKAEVLRRDGGAFVFRGASWRETYRHGAEASRRGDERRDAARRVEPAVARDASSVRKNAARVNATENTPPRIFSDALYSRHLAAHRPLDPAWLEKETIPVLECASSASSASRGSSEDCEDFLTRQKSTRDAFVSEYEARGEPVILRGACAKWAATHADKTKSPWSLDALRARIANKNATFSVGGYPVTLDAWAAYCDACAPSDEGGSGPVDDAPLYLFDKSFVETAPEIFGNASPVGFEPPAIVCGDDEKDDLFALLGDKNANAKNANANDDGDDDARASSSRPDHRWFIHGPARSGSSFHVDPNGTSAWNAVVFGAKRWILFAPDGAPPPGVHPSPDGATVAQPVTLVEWYAGFYEHAYSSDLEETSGDESDDDDARDGAEPEPSDVRRSRKKGSRVKNRQYSVREGTCRAGDVLFVPSGWWHAALNLTETAAVTQNFCSPRTAPRTLRFLKRAAAAGKTPNPGLAADLVSGLESRDKRGSLYADFLEALRKHRPEVLRAEEVRRVLGEDGPKTKTGEEAEADEAEVDEAPGGNPEASDCLSIRAKRPRASPLTRSGRESPPPKKKEKPPAGTNALAGLFAAETAGAESASFAFGF
jgi:hypothetical protein